MLPYSLIVHAYSNLSMEAYARQDGFEPGAHVEVLATLAQSGIPMDEDVIVWTEVTRPNGSSITLPMTADSGQFRGTLVVPTPGVYALRVRARGTTDRGEPFTREKTLTVAVWHGSDSSTNSNGSLTTLIEWLRARDARLCELLTCVLRHSGVVAPELEKRLQSTGFDLNAVRKCLEAFCRCEGCRE
jgi:hypothetical protein